MTNLSKGSRTQNDEFLNDIFGIKTQKFEEKHFSKRNEVTTQKPLGSDSKKEESEKEVIENLDLIISELEEQHLEEELGKENSNSQDITRKSDCFSDLV